ncbi:hypothetical protein [Paenibacillus pinistramenti]|uniref:hypothetical protein n=1 Tax=Paenibacillus pinistramenti TaxID=1768003 RepID=UPI00110921A8|nr:hypothetical protein [Paenibacillus pinistramenti]
MLPDLQRKVLRILFNFSLQRRRMPTWEELERKTGRRRQELWRAFEGLKEQGYIAWEERHSSSYASPVPYGASAKGPKLPDPQRIIMLQSHEPEERAGGSRHYFNGGNGDERIKYWTQY